MSEIANTGATIDETIATAVEQLDDVAEATGKTRRVATPLMKMCGVVGFVPFARDNCDAVNGLFDRFNADREAALSLLHSVGTMDELVNSFQAKSESSTSVDWLTSISSMRSDLEAFDGSMLSLIHI